MIKDIKHMWEEGYSLTQIAQQLNTTRNVIAGKMHRAKQAGIYFEPRTSSVIRKSPSVIHSTNLDSQITRLKIDECRFITNDDTTNAVYCCEPVDRKSYCKHHADICYMKPEKSRVRHNR